MNIEKYAELLNNRHDNGIRINKFIADTGYCSRREADILLKDNKVMIDGVIAEIGSRVKYGQIVKIGEKEFVVKEADAGKNYAQVEKVVLAYNKPRGIICTTDRSEEKNIIDAINYPQRIFPIGRLDKDSSGLILLTNDGDLVNRILRAENGHEKEYLVETKEILADGKLNKLAKGVYLAELNRRTLPCKIQKINSQKMRIILIQGLNRQIRRMCETVGYTVKTLERIRIMNITLGSLRVGEYRKLTFKELQQLESLL